MTLFQFWLFCMACALLGDMTDYLMSVAGRYQGRRERRKSE